MLRMILVFMVVFAMLYIGIEIYSKMNKNEKSVLTKTLIRIIMVAELSLAAIVAFVMIF